MKVIPETRDCARDYSNSIMNVCFIEYA